MENTEELTQFLLKARTKTYAGGEGKVKPAFIGSDQLEYEEGEWFYRDIYYNGNGKFVGLEAIYYQNKPVWSMSYYGNYQGMSEEELDTILRKPLIENWQSARTWKEVEWHLGDYKYI